MSTFQQIEDNVRQNLDDSGVTYFSVADVRNSLQDIYDEICTLTQCVVKKVNLPFITNKNYYNFRELVPDFMAVTAIFSYLTNLWLIDDKTLKDFDRSRPDWENWTGSPIWWAPCNDSKHTALVPKLVEGTNTFDLYYWAQAPTVKSTESPLLPFDFHNLVEVGVTADLLEQAEEYSKAQSYLSDYWGYDESGEPSFNRGIFSLAERIKNISKSDLLMLG